jgi:hypothetical protein
MLHPEKIFFKGKYKVKTILDKKKKFVPLDFSVGPPEKK